MDDGTLTFTSGALSRGCAEGDEMVWEDVRFAVRALRAVVTEDTCASRVDVEGTWIRISYQA